MSLTTISAMDAKEAFSELLNRVAHHHERILITRRDKTIAALVSIEDLNLLQSWQDEFDLKDAINALKDAREQGTIDLNQLEKEIKW